MALIVQKFGGSSVADAERIFNVARIIGDTYDAGNSVVAVVSAQGDTTDDLIAKAQEINPGASKREMDVLLSTGEQISISLLAMALEKLGYPCKSLTGWQAGVLTDSTHGSSRVRRKVLRKYVFAAGGLLIRPAASQKELTDEGNALHHCVSTYGKRHAGGQTAIFFIRRKSSPGSSYYTLELDEKELIVRQNRGLRNAPRTPEVQAFEDLWLSWVRAGAPRDKSGKPVIQMKKGEEVA